MRMLCVLVLGLNILLMPCAVPSRAQTDNPTLPADLLFASVTGERPLFNTLAHVDAQSLEISSFYVDDGSYIRPLSWSPNGDLLAILRHPSLTTPYLEYCLITRDGILQLCLEDRITSYAFGYRQFMVSWSDDGRYIYFVTDYDEFHWTEGDSNDWGASLVKAEAATGQTEEILYQTHVIAHRSPPDLIWTNDLHYLLLYNGLLTSTVVDLWQNTEFPLSQNIPGLGNTFFCSRFSPQGHYLTANVYQDQVLSAWVITLSGGQIVRTIRSDRLQQASISWMSCPVWQSDEAAFYFLGGVVQNEARLFKYVLADDTILTVKQLYPPDPQDSAFTYLFPQSVISLAPDNATLAIGFYKAGSLTIETHFLSPTHEWLTLDDGTYISDNLLWFPAEN
jgi:hypothetical protein